MLNKSLNLSEKGYKDFKRSIISCIITNLCAFLPFAVIMQVMRVIIEPISSGTPLDMGRLWLLVGFGLIALLLYVISYNNEYNKTYTSAYSEATEMRIEVAEHMRKLPMSFFNKKDLSELTTNIMGDCGTIERMISHTIPHFVATCVTITFVCAMLCIYDWRMSLAMFCTLPLCLAMIWGSRNIQTKFGERHVKAKLAVSDQVQEYLVGIKVVKAFGLSGEKSQSLDRSLKEMMKQAIVFEGIAGTFVTIAQVLLHVGIGLVILVGVNLLTAGKLGVIPFLTFVMMSGRIFSPMIAILTMLPEMIYFFVSTKRMQMLRKETVMEGRRNVELKHFDVELKNVNFAYSMQDTIKNMSATIQEGSVTALVGPSGSGKSTVSRLIARFWDVSSGEVCIGGVNVREIEPEHLMRYMSFVFQDVILFNDTIMNNIRIGKEGASDEDVYRVAKMARCDEFICKMPQQYNSMIGENGCTLSGGERQRVSIARALLKDAPIVLLDEATSSLDPENEILIQEAISELVRGRTVIVIAHRLKTVKDANQILVLEDGRLLESGSGEELIRQEGLFSRLYNIQQESLGWSVGNK